MSSLVTWLGYTEIAICMAALCFIAVRKQLKDYWALASFLAFRTASDVSLALLLHFHHAAKEPVARHSLYNAYFFVYWGAFAIESILALFILTSIFRLTTAPLKGLQKLGMVAFITLAIVPVVMALMSPFSPGIAQGHFMIASISQLQRVQSVLTLCLVLFVFLAIRPLGLSFRSNVFGVSLGLGLLAAMDLVQSAWLIYSPREYATYTLVNGLVICTTVAIWAAYFAMREPQRREIVLPASSPFLRLNRMGMVWFE